MAAQNVNTPSLNMYGKLGYLYVGDPLTFSCVQLSPEVAAGTDVSSVVENLINGSADYWEIDQASADGSGLGPGTIKVVESEAEAHATALASPFVPDDVVFDWIPHMIANPAALRFLVDQEAAQFRVCARERPGDGAEVVTAFALSHDSPRGEGIEYSSTIYAADPASFQAMLRAVVARGLQDHTFVNTFFPTEFNDVARAVFAQHALVSISDEGYDCSDLANALLLLSKDLV